MKTYTFHPDRLPQGELKYHDLKSLGFSVYKDDGKHEVFASFKDEPHALQFIASAEAYRALWCSFRDDAAGCLSRESVEYTYKTPWQISLHTETLKTDYERIFDRLQILLAAHLVTVTESAEAGR